MISDEDGISAVKAARAVARSEVEGSMPEASYPARFEEKAGVFVTFSTHPDGRLRGCIGYPHPSLPIMDALEGAARAACHDPRFRDLSHEELDGIVVEVTILSPPEPIDVPRESLPSAIEIGRHGLIISCRGRRGLLLPQVPVEWGWDAEEYLENLSMKAGLPPDAWKRGDAEILSFEGEVFRESEPHGIIKRV